jgi:putative DNA primase/helicase
VTAPEPQGGRAPNLLDFHLHQLHASAISDDVIRERGYQSVGRPTAGDSSSRDRLKRLGIPGWARGEDARFPGLLIPLHRATGELTGWQYRPDVPPKDLKTGKIRKYAAQAGRSSVLDVHPRWRSAMTDPTVPLWITEGVKKADSLTSQGQCAVALSGVFNWRSKLGSLGDWEDVQLRGRQVNICFDADIRENTQVGRAMERLGNWLRSKGASPVVYVVPPGVNGIVPKGVDDFFAARGTLELLWTGSSLVPPVAPPGPKVDPDGYMVEQLAEDALDGRYLWCPELGWLRYGDSDGRWKQVTDVAVADEIRRWLIGKHRDAVTALSETVKRGAPAEEIRQVEAQAAAWRVANSRQRIGNLLALARGLVMEGIAEFDAHPDLLNTPDDVVHLPTRERRPHDPDLLLTQVTRARYVPGAAHPDWDKALEAIPSDVRDYMQLRYGQGITGHVPPDDKVVIQLGKGSNGKTTIAYSVQGALGKGYFRLISERAVIADKSQHPTELMDFRGARVAVLEELAEERRLSMRRIKVITGPEITARYCGKDTTTYDSTHALVISTNHDPFVLETDNGSWRRLMALRYPCHYFEPAEMPVPPGPYDKVAESGLRERLRDGGDGRGEAVLAWLVDGAAGWYEGDEAAGRDPGTFGAVPDRIRKDTDNWRAGSNPMFAYVTGHLTPDPQAHAMTAELASCFKRYLEAGDHPPWSDPTIAARFNECCDSLGIRVAKKFRRADPASLSRPAGYESVPPPDSYQSWSGIRFKTADDLREEADAAASGGTDEYASPQASDIRFRGIRSSGRNIYSGPYAGRPGDLIPLKQGQPSGRMPDINGVPHYDFAVLHQMADHSAGAGG